MEKLIELLNEYERYLALWWIADRREFDWNLHYYSEYNDEYVFDHIHQRVISKKFWFIKWLVENDKIDLDACEWEKTYNNLTASRDSNYTQYERLLMALALQDEPIRFLCEILK